jgi:hypothetical protein
VRVPADPDFIRPVKRSALACVAALMVAALFLPPPLQEAADPGNPPNPAKSAWFLLWVQELVSHGTSWIWPAVAAAVAAVALPWIPGRGTRIDPGDGTPPAERAGRGGGRFLAALSLALLLLTLAALFFRGRDWAWVSPF